MYQQATNLKPQPTEHPLLITQTLTTPHHKQDTQHWVFRVQHSQRQNKLIPKQRQDKATASLQRGDIQVWQITSCKSGIYKYRQAAFNNITDKLITTMIDEP